MAEPNIKNKSQFIKSMLAERSKSFRIYDGNNRLTDLYEAPVGTVDNEDCLHTQFTYTGATDLTIEKTSEGVGTWLAAYDI